MLQAQEQCSEASTENLEADASLQVIPAIALYMPGRYPGTCPIFLHISGIPHTCPVPPLPSHAGYPCPLESLMGSNQA